MRARTALVTTGLAVAAVLGASTPAMAQPLDRGRFHDSPTGVFTCTSTHTDIRFDGHVWVNFLFNLRGSSPFGYYQESATGTIVYTNLSSGGTYTNAFVGNSKDISISDNGDGTITITTMFTGSSRWYDTHGTLVLMDTGLFRFSVKVNYNGTPSNPEDDFEVPNSFTPLTDTGLNQTDGRDFCEDMELFTR